MAKKNRKLAKEEAIRKAAERKVVLANLQKKTFDSSALLKQKKPKATVNGLSEPDESTLQEWSELSECESPILREVPLTIPKILPMPSLQTKTGLEPLPKELIPSKREHDEPSIKKTKKKKVLNRPTLHVPVNRRDDINLARSALPVVHEEQVIMEAIFENDIIMLCAETGSGKTTQVPQFLYEAGFGDPSNTIYPGMIGITQPRKVAAISTAERVADEMNVKGVVGYQVRYDKHTVQPSTRIKYMTDGVLVREIAGHQESGQFLLPQYSCIILDEVHERSVNTDILIGWLSRIVALRQSGRVAGIGPLKLIIMSASLDVQMFRTNALLFPKGLVPPLISVSGRQHRVTVHYNRITPELDFLQETCRKVLKIHKALPPGGILVFVTSRADVDLVITNLRSELGLDPITIAHQGNDEFEEDFRVLPHTEPLQDSDDDEEDEVEYLGDESTEPEERPTPKEVLKPVFLPLYSMLPVAEQMKVFKTPEPGTRHIIVCTNVAETSVTIPGIRYVVDTGKVKEKMFEGGIERFRVGWTSKSSAIQRAGRAGRTGPGHCYRLFSSAVFSNYFANHSDPEIVRVPVEGVVLFMKSIGIQKVDRFPLPTPFDVVGLREAEKLLVHLNALTPVGDDLQTTELGTAIADLPISPRFSKMIYVTMTQYKDLLPHVVALVAGLVVGAVFENPDEPSNSQRQPLSKILAVFVIKNSFLMDPDRVLTS